MTPARWQQIEDLYYRAQEMDELQRAAFLRQSCAGDDGLRQEVEELLADEAQAASFLEEPALREIALEFAGTAESFWVGREIGNYRFVSLAGAGGMGEVYRARDTKLKREVAIKVLPQEFSSDPERVSRFQREAELLASLNHPNIAAIYDLEEANGLRFLILELVEGETLQDRLNRGPIPLDDAIQIAAQIADGLAAAHERGIIHRDLKPANIKLTPEGKVKVLDFGLAKVFADEGADADLSNSSTNARASTPGTILGTAAYMSPEQAQGKPADKRADIWAFGVVLYEMLTGRRLFEGDTARDMMAAVLTKQPEWDRIPAMARPLLRRCLMRDPQRRLRDIGDAMSLLENTDTMPQPVPSGRPRLAWSAAILFLLGFSLLSFVYFRETAPPPGEPTRFRISPPDKMSFARDGTFSLSPDGRRLVYWAQGADNIARLWLQDLNALEPRLLPDTEAAGVAPGPTFWSPDGRFVVFETGGKLRQIDVTGGTAQTISEVSNAFWGGSWNKDDVIIFGNGSGGIRRVSAADANGSAVTAVDLSRQEIAHRTPYFLPDGIHFLYHRLSNTPENSGIYVGSLDAKPDEQSSKQLVASRAGPVYVPSRGANAGQLLFLRDSTLFAQTFDTRKMELTGEPVAVADQVDSTRRGGMALFSVSTNGVLISKASGQDLQLTWYDRKGTVLGTVGEPGRYTSLDLSPDGTQVIVSRTDPRSANQDLYLLDLLRKTPPERFTFDPAHDLMPAWSPDGRHIAFLSDRNGGGLYQKALGGLVNEERLLQLGSIGFLSDWSPDGRFLVYAIEGGPQAGADLWFLPLNGERKPIPFARNIFRENYARFSPDMNWIADAANEFASGEIYVQPFNASPDAGTSSTASRWKVSKHGGTMPRWRRDSRELYYLGSDAKVMAVEISHGPGFQHGEPKPLFQVLPSFLSTGPQGLNLLGDVTADGQRFLFAIPVNPRNELSVVLNWQAELRK